MGGAHNADLLGQQAPAAMCIEAMCVFTSWIKGHPKWN